MFSLVLALILGVPSAHAASRTDVKQVTDYMFGRKESAQYVKPLWMSDWAMAKESPVYRVVFVVDGKRYTMQYRSATEYDPAALDFWERPDGSTGQAVLSTYGDDGLNGYVDYGVGPKPTGTSWQDKYDAAIAAAIKYYQSQPDTTPSPAPTANPPQ